MSQTVGKISQMKIPKFMRNKLFKTYSRFYTVNLDDIIQPLNSFETFGQFFTRKVKPRPIIDISGQLLSPADSKILSISQITNDKCLIIKGSSYSLGELLTGNKAALSIEQIKQMKKYRQNKLFQIVLYLAPGDYHRFHSPAKYQLQRKEKINGYYYSVNEKALLKKKTIYEKNTRVCLHGQWQCGYLGMIMVGALNVGRIVIEEKQNFKKGQELGHFNLGSTIVMIVEIKEGVNWNVYQGKKIRYGQALFQNIV